MRVKKEYATIQGIQDRKNLGYAAPQRFPNWNVNKYPSRLGFGMNLKEYAYKNDDVWHYTHHGVHYWIKKEVAIANVQHLNLIPSLPDLIPIECWDSEKIPVPESKQEKLL